MKKNKGIREMKHKSQEALDILYDEASCECEVDEGTGELLMFDCTNHDKYLNIREPLQQLINCQLTKNEIGTLLHVYKRYSAERNIPFVSDSDIICKLNKQRELWEE